MKRQGLLRLYRRHGLHIGDTGNRCWIGLNARMLSATHKVSGSWVFKDTRVPVNALFENLEGGASVDDFLAWFLVSSANRSKQFWSTPAAVSTSYLHVRRFATAAQCEFSLIKELPFPFDKL